MALQEATTLLGKLKDALKKGDLGAADTVLGQIKLKLIHLPALPPTFEQTATAQQELLLAREVLEHAVLLSVRRQDDAAMERAFAQLKTFYNDTRSLLPAAGSQEVSLFGLNLLRLLVQNRIAEFHTELELITPQVQADPAIQQPVQLEQWLMEGAYNKVLAASKQAVSQDHGLLLAQLASTVRDEAASCSEKAYGRLSLRDAAELLLLDSDAAVRAYAEQHKWAVADGYILFGNTAAAAAGDGKGDGAVAVPSLELINNALVYAKELERIV